MKTRQNLSDGKQQAPIDERQPSDRESAPSDPARRQWLTALAAAVGGTALTGLAPVEVALAFTPREDRASAEGKVLTRLQLQTLEAICRQVIPTTDTPGAAEVDVHGFVDHQIAACHTRDEQARVQRSLDGLERKTQSDQGQSFHQLTATSQRLLLTDLEGTRNGFSGGDRADFKFLKNLIVFGYYTSEVGATQELRFDPVPGGFQGDYPYPADGRAWWR